jgi:hypothetical protein
LSASEAAGRVCRRGVPRPNTRRLRDRRSTVNGSGLATGACPPATSSDAAQVRLGVEPAQNHEAGIRKHAWSGGADVVGHAAVVVGPGDVRIGGEGDVRTRLAHVQGSAGGDDTGVAAVGEVPALTAVVPGADE